jgi:hypothetical protein
VIFIWFDSPFEELQNDIKIFRKKHWPPHKILRILLNSPGFIAFCHLFSMFLIDLAKTSDTGLILLENILGHFISRFHIEFAIDNVMI